MSKTDYIPLIIHKANERGLDDEMKKLLVAFEIAGQHEDFFGVDYVAGEHQVADGTVGEKVDAFIQDTVNGRTEYEEHLNRLMKQYGEEVYTALDKYN